MLKQIKDELNTLQIKVNSKDGLGVVSSADRLKRDIDKIRVDVSATESEQERKEADRALSNTVETVELIYEEVKLLEKNIEDRVEMEVAKSWIDISGDIVVLESNICKLDTMKHVLKHVELEKDTVKTSPLSSMNLI